MTEKIVCPWCGQPAKLNHWYEVMPHNLVTSWDGGIVHEECSGSRRKLDEYRERRRG